MNCDLCGSKVVEEKVSWSVFIAGVVFDNLASIHSLPEFLDGYSPQHTLVYGVESKLELSFQYFLTYFLVHYLSTLLCSKIVAQPIPEK